MGMKLVSAILMLFLVFPIAYANPITDFFSGITGFFVGLVTEPETSSLWQCSGYCDSYVSSTGLTSCNWVKSQLVEGPDDPTGSVCCIAGAYVFTSTGQTTYYWQGCTAYSTAEICNGIDDDGDGVVDQINKTCSTNVGICTQGTQICIAGEWSDCTGTMPQSEKCNGVDDDCDGTVDEGCISYPTYTGYSHYCQNITLAQRSDVYVSGYFKSINDSYMRVFTAGIDCAYSEGKRIWATSGCISDNCEGGRYCYIGTGASGTYSYKFENMTAGNHRICLWPTSITGYLWNITMSYTATPVQEACTTVGGACTLDRANYCNSWLCDGYCNKTSYLSACLWISDKLKISETNPAGTVCCTEFLSGGGFETGVSEPDQPISFMPTEGTYDLSWKSCDLAYEICGDVTGSLPSYYSSSCVCLPKKTAGASCAEDYECFNTSCMSGFCQAEDQNVCGDGVCELPESSEYCAEGSCCTTGGDCWVYCPQDCAETYCGDGICNEQYCISDCGYLALSTAMQNVTLGSKAYFSMVYSHLPTLTVTDPTGSKVTSYSFSEVSDEAQLFSRVYEFTPIKTGVYMINAYIMPSGVKTIEVSGTIKVLQPPANDTCGDGACGSTENATSCAADCYVTPNVYCGDSICNEQYCVQDCGYADVYATKKSAYIDENVEFRVNHTQGTLAITVKDPDMKIVSFYSIYTVASCSTGFCLDKYYFKPAKAGVYTVTAKLLLNNNTVTDADYVTIIQKPPEPGWILLASSDHVDSGHYLCGELTLQQQSIIKIKGVFENTNDQYARFLLSCVDCNDILNTWALTTTAGWALYNTETRCETERTSGEFCIMGCCSEGTYMTAHNVSAGTHTLCIWPTCPDIYSNVDRIWKADLYYNISHVYPAPAAPGTNITEPNATEPYCGNGIHDPGETQSNCCVDVGCPAHQFCSGSNECVSENLPPAENTTSYCGNGIHDPGETQDNCCVDVGCPANYYCSESLNKCVKNAEDMDPTRLLTVALNIEVLRIKLENLADSVQMAQNYYEGKGDTVKAAKWSEILSDFNSLIDELSSMSQTLRQNQTESALEDVRRSMTSIRAQLRAITTKVLEAY